MNKHMVLLLLPWILLSCRDAGENPTDPYVPAPSPPPQAQIHAVVQADNVFTFDLFRRVAATEEASTFFLSPFSVSMALGMTLNGADGSTFDSIRAVLGFASLSREEINESYRLLAAYLQAADGRVTMEIANSIWYRIEFPVDTAFLNVNRSAFGAEIAGLNFNDPAAVTTINGWVSAKTHGKIPTIVEQIPSETVLYLINALYFKGLWTIQFDRDKTQDGQFFTSSGTSVPCRMMTQYDTFAYSTVDGVQAIDLPYGSGRFSMTVVLPPIGTDIDAFSRSWTQASYEALVSALDSEKVRLSLPRFKVEYKRTLSPDLKAMGMTEAFLPGIANFSRINPSAELFISNVLQKTYVAVDEEGTEAAAVTVVEIGVTSVPQEISFRADHPFLFVIREKETGAILFIGKVGEV